MTSPQNSGSQSVFHTRGPAVGWLAVAAMLTDLAFETDPMGRFTAFGPGRVMGQPAARLLGVEAATLLSGNHEDEAVSVGQFRTVITTICIECVAWHGKIRMMQPDGRMSTYRLSLAPRIAAGEVVGTYGILFDLDTPDLVLPERHADRADEPGFCHAQALDAETGLWSARNFTGEVARRCDRLDIEDLPGTLLCLGFAKARATSVAPVAIRLAQELRDIVRPTDILGRIDATTIGLWCDGMDHLTGGERAAKFCTMFPATLPDQTLIMVGVASRRAGSGDDPATMIERGRVALRLAETDAGQSHAKPGAGAWRVWQRE